MMTAFADWRGWRAASAVLAILKAGATSSDGTIDVVALHAASWAKVKPHLFGIG